MSIRLMSIAWELDIPITDKMVMLCLCDFANDHGECWPSASTIARKCSLTERSVRRIYNDLKARNLLQITERNGTSSVFKVTPDTVSPLTLTTQPLTQCPPPPDTVSAKPSLNHQEPPIDKTTRAKPAHSLPSGWQPILTPAAQRTVDGWPPGRFEQELAAFTDHAADKGRTSKDWQAAFRTWINNATKWTPKNDRPSIDRRDGAVKALDRRLGFDDTSVPFGRHDFGEGGGYLALPAP